MSILKTLGSDKYQSTKVKIIFVQNKALQQTITFLWFKHFFADTSWNKFKTILVYESQMTIWSKINFVYVK